MSDLRENTWGLFVASFLCSLEGGILLTCLPFILTDVGGTEKEVGFGLVLNFASYLTGCVLGGLVMDRFSPKRTLQVSAVMMTVSSAGIYGCVVFFC